MWDRREKEGSKLLLRILARPIGRMLPLTKMGQYVEEVGFRRKLGVRFLDRLNWKFLLDF